MVFWRLTAVGVVMAALLAAIGTARAQAAAPAAPTGKASPAGQIVAVLQALDKVTGRTRLIDAPLGQEIKFGSLDLVVRACDKRPPEEPPESAAFLEIDDTRVDQPRRRVFTGWMVASSPAISALEHPVYDVWVIDCKIVRP